jgi:hypothetical protein
MKRNILRTVNCLSFLIVSILSLSCASIETKTSSSPTMSPFVSQVVTATVRDVTGAIPQAFQGWWTSGGQGNPNAEIVLDTTLPEVVPEIMTYRIEKIGDAEALTVAKSFGLENNPVPFKGSSPDAVRAVYSYTDNVKTLEVYPIGRVIYRDSQRNRTSPATLPSEEECTEIAKKTLLSAGIYPHDVIRLETGVSGTVAYSDGSGSTVFQATSFMVRFVSAINGFECFNSSATVTLGDQGKIVELTVNSPKLNEFGTASLKTSEQALNVLKSYLTNSSFNPPEAKECTVNLRGFQKLTINKISLLYLSTDRSDFLVPIYVFEGEVQENLHNPKTEHFVGRVDAVDHQ